jgi:hypothetical protein
MGGSINGRWKQFPAATARFSAEGLAIGFDWVHDERPDWQPTQFLAFNGGGGACSRAMSVMLKGSMRAVGPQWALAYFAEADRRLRDLCRLELVHLRPLLGVQTPRRRWPGVGAFGQLLVIKKSAQAHGSWVHWVG